MSTETDTTPKSSCPVCGRAGKSGVEDYCHNHLPKDMHPKYFHSPLGEEDKHILGSFENKYNVDREFFPTGDNFGIIKDKFGIEK